MDHRARIVAATIDCLAGGGLEATTISAVAKRAGVSRPTVYAHFGTRDDLVSGALEVAAIGVLERCVAEASVAGSAADFVVTLSLAVVRELRESRIAALMQGHGWDGRMFAADAVTPRVLVMANELVRPVVAFQPDLQEHLTEITETMIRMVLSVLMFESENSRSEATLRDYLNRRLVPALGITPTT